MVDRGFADDRIAADYVAFDLSRNAPMEAWNAWTLYATRREPGYLNPNLVFNGSFERDASGANFDWKFNDAADVRVERDASVARTGTHSLKIRFGGEGDPSYDQTFQLFHVAPGDYHFQAFVRADGLTTNSGIRFRFLDEIQPERLNVKTDQVLGSSDWKPVDQLIHVSEGTEWLRLLVIRERSWKFDAMRGTAWIDDVSLRKEQ
jgi:hypothetical protein